MKHAKSQYHHASRRLKRATNKIQNDKFAQSLLGGNKNIFEEIKKYRGIVRKTSSVIDGEVGSANNANHFANNYENLYNKSDIKDELRVLRNDINEDINTESIKDVKRVNDDIVRSAMRKMKK